MTIAARVLEHYRGDPKRWTQRAFCRDVGGTSGASTFVVSPNAVCWCLAGALAATTLGLRIDTEQTVALARALGFERVSDMGRWQDDPARTFEEIEARLRAAA